MHRLLAFVLIAPLAAYAGDLKITVHGRIDAVVVLGALEPRLVPPAPSRHHLSAPRERARDACTFVAGVRHCPLPPRGEPK